MVSLPETKVWLQGRNAFARCSVWKGHEVSEEQLVAFYANDDHLAAINLFERWARRRPTQARFFALDNYPLKWYTWEINAAIECVFPALSITPPPDGKFTSYSLRIGAHTEKVLLGIPLEAHKARFGWGPNSHGMAALYFGRTIQNTAASYWFFGAWTICAVAATPSTS